MLVRALREVGTYAFPKAPNHEFDVTQAYLFPEKPLTPLALMLAESKAPLLLSEQTKRRRRKTPPEQRDRRVAPDSVAGTVWPSNRWSSVNLSDYQKGNRE